MAAAKAVSLVSACLLLSALAGVAGAQEAGEIAPGVRFEAIRDPDGPFEIRVVTVELSAASTLDVALAQDQLPGFETTSSMARRHRAVVAINADFALPSGRPVHPYAEDGRLLQAPVLIESSFAVNRGETTSFVGTGSTPALEMAVGQGRRYPVHRINDGLGNRDEIAAFTAEGGDVEPGNGDWCSARLAENGEPTTRDGGRIEIEYVVRKARCAKGLLDPVGDGIVLAASAGATYAPLVASLDVDERVTLAWSVGWPDVFDLTGGNPVLLFRGDVAAGVEPPDGITDDAFFKRQPRTGIGVTHDGHVLLVTVDGRKPGYSAGMTLREFAELFQRLGATEALNLDGGGSTTMVVDGVVRNRPASSGDERAVASALLVLPGGDTGEQEPPAVDPDISLKAVWHSIASDPGSTGGLAASIPLDRLPLVPELREAARLFEETSRRR
ncbi:MAG: phosphodiester glycosidase family protein [Egibacteraceae bacterium]